MSISVGGFMLAQAASSRTSLNVLASVAFVAVVLGGVAGVIPPRRVAGPVRIPDESPALPLATVLFGSFGFYLFSYLALAQFWPTISSRFGLGDPDLMHSEIGVAISSCLPPIVGLIGMWVGDRAVFPVVHQRLGMGLSLVPVGLLRGILAAAIVMPLMFLAEDITEFVYQASHFQHPAEHPLLKAMGESPSLFVRGALIVGATVIAPLWEESFFRGHVQTLLRRMFSRLLGGKTSNPHESMSAWLSIIITAAMFAMLHDAWTWPIIFLLALCLGYAYERTGNLWISITIHSAFNCISTLLFLFGAGAN